MSLALPAPYNRDGAHVEQTQGLVDRMRNRLREEIGGLLASMDVSAEQARELEEGSLSIHAE